MAMPPRDSNLGWYQSTKARRKAALRVFLLLVKFSPSIPDHCTYPRSSSLLPPPSAEHHADLPLPPSSKGRLTPHRAPRPTLFDAGPSLHRARSTSTSPALRT
ncbi:hypothetical protein DFH07DRAFT_960873 [Mycena maculata]|uniref:Uncharacterized protein n=1 Tax=Mycena maculata TaxID=230809 RepID=A0AAD7IZE3_9AGAR|nr:hypothetical protein DFH07DRAFT_960873 [Mycena maculata]